MHSRDGNNRTHAPTRQPHYGCVCSFLPSRNGTAASTIMEQAKKLNPESEVVFIKADSSLIKNVDAVCKAIQSKERKINLLFVTAGYLTFEGRNGAPRRSAFPLQLPNLNQRHLKVLTRNSV